LRSAGGPTRGRAAPSAGKGRTAALLLGVMNLFVLPFGTALAIYTFWVLMHNDARAFFEAAHADRGVSP
jgi:hypothetical protein